MIKARLLMAGLLRFRYSRKPLEFERQFGRQHVNAQCLAHCVIGQFSGVYVQAVQQMFVIVAGIAPALVGQIQHEGHRGIAKRNC